MRFASFFTSALISLLILALTIAFACRAGDTDTPPASEDTFTFETHDRRDPFTFMKTIPKTNDPALLPGEADPLSNRMDAAQIAAKKALLLQAASAAEQHLMDYKYAEAVAACERGLDELHGVAVNEYRELQDGRDALVRLSKVGARGKRRDDAERDLQIINPHLTGVLVSQHLPRAIVNGKIVSVGDTVSVQDAEASVFSIERDHITLIYRNYRVAVVLDK
jgi:hypothetical protein